MISLILRSCHIIISHKTPSALQSVSLLTRHDCVIKAIQLGLPYDTQCGCTRRHPTFLNDIFVLFNVEFQNQQDVFTFLGRLFFRFCFSPVLLFTETSTTTSVTMHCVGANTSWTQTETQAERKSSNARSHIYLYKTDLIAISVYIVQDINQVTHTNKEAELEKNCIKKRRSNLLPFVIEQSVTYHSSFLSFPWSCGLTAFYHVFFLYSLLVFC